MHEDGPHILIVDDDPSIREVFECFLTMQGYTVRTAADGAEALRQLQREHPEVMLLDNYMPNMTGLEVLQHLRAAAPEIAVILISGALDADTRNAAHALGAITCLQKPVALPDLERCLAACGKAQAATLRVLLVDDCASLRHTLAVLLQEERDIQVVGEAANGQEGLDLARHLQPDVVLMDIHMPVMNGIEATRRIHAELPAVRVIGLSNSEELEQVAAMREAGAMFYLTKSGPAQDLLATIRAAARRLS